MNAIGIDFGTKNIGLALGIMGVISPLKTLPNNQQIFMEIKKIIDEYQIEKIYIGISMGKMARLTNNFVVKLKQEFSIPIELVDESVSTIESAKYIAVNNKKYSQKVDSISAAIILKRALL